MFTNKINIAVNEENIKRDFDIILIKYNENNAEIYERKMTKYVNEIVCEGKAKSIVYDRGKKLYVLYDKNKVNIKK